MVQVRVQVKTYFTEYIPQYVPCHIELEHCTVGAIPQRLEAKI